jgi:uracil-DNA glycosylase
MALAISALDLSSMDIVLDLPKWKSFFRNNSSLLEDILDTIDRSGQNIRPDRSDVLGIYRLLSPQKIRVIIMGQSPYPDDNACGIPFVSKKGLIPKTLSILKEEIALEYGIQVHDPNDMVESWVSQGVFIVNSSPTIGIGKDKPYMYDHSILWREFMMKLVEFISKKEVPVLLLGKDAWEFEQSSSSECIIKVPHPVSRGDKKFVGCMLFSKTNEYLETRGLSTISWV